jgi:phosphatidylglycerol phospholipase C
MLQRIMTGPVGGRFLRDIKRAGRPIFLWTINEEEQMKWSIRKQVDGVITDDPKKFLEVCKRYKGEKPKLKWKELGMIVFMKTLAFPVSFLFRRKFGARVDEKEIRGLLEEASKNEVHRHLYAPANKLHMEP